MNHWQFSSDTPAKAGPEHPTLAVVMFYAVWCGKCAMMRPVIEDLEKKYQKKIFDKFFQIPDSTQNKEASTGLGLTIAKEFVKLHNGTIEVQSEPKNGAEFIIKLPYHG